MAIGGKGVISTSSNIAPGLVCDIVRRFEAGDVAGARARHYELLPLFDVLFCETNPIPVKAAMAMMGLIPEGLRLPLTTLTEGNRGELKQVLTAAGLP